jgi:hypothetical protein
MKPSFPVRRILRLAYDQLHPGDKGASEQTKQQNGEYLQGEDVIRTRPHNPFTKSCLGKGIRDVDEEATVCLSLDTLFAHFPNARQPQI